MRDCRTNHGRRTTVYLSVRIDEDQSRAIASRVSSVDRLATGAEVGAFVREHYQHAVNTLTRLYRINRRRNAMTDDEIAAEIEADAARSLEPGAQGELL